MRLHFLQDVALPPVTGLGLKQVAEGVDQHVLNKNSPGL